MSRTLIVLAAALALSVPTALAAPPEGKGKPESPGNSAAAPGQSAEQNAAKKCKAERSANPEAFKNAYGTNANKANAFGKCVSSKVKKAKQAEEEQAQEARENAAKKCKAERASNPEAFKNTYGTNANKANAFGKCVSKHAKKATTG
jgi:hypothetical protein